MLNIQYWIDNVNLTELLMMLIFEDIQINASDSVCQKPPPLRTCIVWDNFQGNEELRRLREAMNRYFNKEKRRDADCQLPNLELNRWELILKYCNCMS